MLVILNQMKSEISDLGSSLDDIPWWRVLLSVGKISPRMGNGDLRQATILAQEGVVVLSAYIVDLKEYGWFPEEIDDES